MKQLFILLSLFTSTSLMAQTNFSGNWTQQSVDYITGPKYGNAIQQAMQVKQTKDSLVQVQGLGDNQSYRSATALNGKAYSWSSATAKRKFTNTTAWSADKKTLTITTVFSMPDNENETDFTRVEIWTLSPDGKELTIDKKSIETRFETWEVKATFIKQ